MKTCKYINTSNKIDLCNDGKQAETTLYYIYNVVQGCTNLYYSEISSFCRCVCIRVIIKGGLQI